MTSQQLLYLMVRRFRLQRLLVNGMFQLPVIAAIAIVWEQWQYKARVEQTGLLTVERHQITHQGVSL
jgi:hypothetical protein